MTIGEWFSDAATGMTDEREELQRIRDMAAAGRIDTFIIDRVDRLARRASLILALIDELEEMRVRVVAVSQYFDDSPVGRLMRTVAAGIAEYQRAEWLGRMRQCKREAARNGRFAGGGIPLGYRRGATPGLLEIDSTGAREVREVFAMRHNGRSLGAIAVAMTSSTGRPWTATSVRNVLNRADFYAGRAPLHRSLAGNSADKAMHPAILSPSNDPKPAPAATEASAA